MSIRLRYVGHRPGASLSYFTGASVGLAPGDLLEIPHGDSLLGRRATADLRVASSIVAPHHLRLRRSGDDVEVTEALGAKGSELNGVRVVAGTKLGPGDRLTIAGAFYFDVVE